MKSCVTGAECIKRKISARIMYTYGTYIYQNYYIKNFKRQCIWKSRSEQPLTEKEEDLLLKIEEMVINSGI